MRRIMSILGKALATPVVLSLCLNLVPMTKAIAAEKTTAVNAKQETVAEDEEVTWNSPSLLIDSYNVSEGKIIPGKPFTLTLTIKNYGGVDAKNLILNVNNPQGVSPVYGTVSQIYIGDINSGESKEVQLKYDSYTSITSDYLDFTVGVASLTYSNYVVMSIPVSTDSPFSISAASGPENMVTNQKATYSVSFKVIGNENVSGVTVLLSVDGQKVGENNIGILTPGTTKTQNISTQFSTPGIYNVEQVITYVDGNGVTQMMLAKATQVIVTESDTPNVTPLPNDNESQYPDQPALSSKMYILVLAGAMVMVIFLMVAILVKKRK